MFWRLVATYSVLLLGSIALLGAVLAGRVERHHERQINNSLRARAVLVREIVRDWPGDRLPLLQERVAALRQEVATRITLLDKNGGVLADSEENPLQMENHADRPEIESARDIGFGSAKRFSKTLGKSMMYFALRTEPGSGAVSYVRVALPLDTIEEQLAELDRIVWTAALVTSVATMALAFWLARRITRPLQELTRGAQRLAAGKYGHKVYAVGQDEAGTLARAFNQMSEGLATQFSQLEEDRQQLRTILSGMVEGVVALDADQRILFANERAAHLLGFQAQTVVGRKLWETVRQRALQDAVRRALEGPDAYSGELNWEGLRGKSLTLYAARLPGAPPRGAVLVLHETTELRRLERLRQEFVANVSHELKTPLSVITACVETLLDGAVDDPAHRGPFLHQIAQQADRLHALILDLLSLARVESGEDVFTYQAVALEPVVAACLDRHRARAEAKDQRLEAVCAGEVVRCWGGERQPPPRHHVTTSPRHHLTTSVATWADEEAVGQILENLVDNALKYTPAGGRIWVRWRAEDGQVCLEVEDTGIGIPERDLPHIFERFYRVDKARSREMGGTGLGLSIVKHLVQAMQGSIHATSRLGQGTTFHIRLPQATAA